MELDGFQFERFTETNKNFASRVTLRQNGQFGFNDGARNSFGIVAGRYAVLYFDASRMVVGVKLTDDAGEPGAIRIRGGQNNTFIPAKAFLDRYGIPYGESTRFELKKLGDMMVFHLEQPIVKEQRSEKKTAS